MSAPDTASWPTVDWSRYGWGPGRYRWRTWFRTHLPYRPPLFHLVPKGRGDCGNHDWYNRDGVNDDCYHCVATRPRPPRVPD